MLNNYVQLGRRSPCIRVRWQLRFDEERELRRGQKTVERNEKQHAKQANYKHMVRILPGSIVTAEALQLAAREQ